MAHDEFQALADVTAAPMTLEHKLGTLEQQRRLRGVFLSCKLVQPPVQIFGYTQIHRHTIMVPNEYQAAATGNVEGITGHRRLILRFDETIPQLIYESVGSSAIPSGSWS